MTGHREIRLLEIRRELCSLVCTVNCKFLYVMNCSSMVCQLKISCRATISKVILVRLFLSDRSDEVAETVLFRPFLHEGTGGDSQQGEPVQDPTLPPRRTGQAGRDLRGLESVCQDEGQGMQ